MFKCGICGKEFNTVEERMEHESHCVAVHKEAERKRKIEAKKVEEERKNRLAKQEEERIQKEYADMIKDVKNFEKIYNKPVKLRKPNNDVDDIFYRSNILNPFLELFFD